MPDVAANNAFDRFTLQAQDAARRALGIAEERDHPAIDSAHLLAALMEQPAIAGRLRAVACDPIVLARYVDALLDSIPSRPPDRKSVV
jgi:ATP-dependent Clp protease ATP-binding subunit ClpA